MRKPIMQTKPTKNPIGSMNNSNMYLQNSQMLSNNSLSNLSNGLSQSPMPNYDVNKVYDLFMKTDKNPIALLHEYCSKIKRNVTYQFDIKNQNIESQVNNIYKNNSIINSSSINNSLINKREHYICSIFIDKLGVIAKGDGCSKKEAKNNAGEKALSILINTDYKARMILGELLDRQASNITGINKNIGTAIRSYESHTNVVEKPVNNYANNTQNVHSTTNHTTIQPTTMPSQKEPTNPPPTNSLGSSINFSTFALRNSQINASQKFNNVNGSYSLFPKPSYAGNTNTLQNNGFLFNNNNQTSNNSGMDWKFNTTSLPLQSLEKVSLVELLKNDNNFLARLSSFANSLSLNLKWKLKQDKNLCVAECTIGDMQAMAVYRKKRTAKLLAAKNMLKVIDGNQCMKTKLVNFLYGNNVGKPLSENSTNISLIRDIKFSLKSAVKANTNQKSILEPTSLLKYSGKPKDYMDKSGRINYDEPQEIIKWFQSLDHTISTSPEDMTVMKDYFDDVSNILKFTLENFNIQLIPIGSFVIGCLRKSNNTIDSYLHLDHISTLNCSELSRLFEEKKFGNDCPDEMFYRYSIQIEKDP